MTIQIVLRLPSEQEKTVTLPNNIKLGRLVPALVSKLDLPTYAADGSSLRYSLRYDGQRLGEDVTLATANIPAEATLYLESSRLAWQGAPAVSSSSPRRSEPVQEAPPSARSGSERRTQTTAASRPQANRQSETAAGPIRNRSNFQIGRFWPLLIVFFAVWGAISDNFSSTTTVEVSNLPRLATIVAAVEPTPTLTAQTPVAIIELDEAALVVYEPLVVDEQLYFFKEDEEGVGLWRLDMGATERWKSRLMTVSQTFDSSLELVVRDDNIYFLSGATRQLWVIPAGADAPQQYSPTQLVMGHVPLQYNNNLLFTPLQSDEQLPLYLMPDSFALSIESSGSQQLVESNEVVGSTVPITDTADRSGRLDPTPIKLPVYVGPDWHQHAAELDGILYFTGWDKQAGDELWRTDGTVTGTYRVRDIRPGQLSSQPRDLIHYGEYVYFAATDEDGENELWRTRGTEAGTTIIANLNANSSSEPDHLTVIDDKLLFSARVEKDRILYVYDAESGERQRLLPEGVDGYTIGDQPNQLTLLEEKVVFIVRDRAGLRLLLQFDLSSETTTWLAPAALAPVGLYSTSDELFAIDRQGQPFLFEPGTETFRGVGNVGALYEMLIDQHDNIFFLEQSGLIWKLRPENSLPDLIANLQYLTTSP